MSKKLTHAQFIDRANIAHNFKYKYITQYSGTDNHIIINCDIHGDFKQLAGNHLYGQGCPKCGNIKIGNKRRKGSNQFFIEARKVHGNLYEYIENEYFNSYTKISIICNKHGIFKQNPRNHLRGSKCPKCVNENRSVLYRKDYKLFIEQSNLIHNNKYKYYGEYINCHKNICIECPIHGLFNQIPLHHLRGHGCSKCGIGANVSKMEIEWLTFMKVPEIYRQAKIKINNVLIKADAYDPVTNTIYEFYGDFWHGNPKTQNFDETNSFTKKTFKEMYEETINRETIIKKAGYNLIFIWEYDWKKLIINQLSIN